MKATLDHTSPFQPPPPSELAAFFEAFPTPLFGGDYMIVFSTEHGEFFLCEIVAPPVDGKPGHAEILPFN